MTPSSTATGEHPHDQHHRDHEPPNGNREPQQLLPSAPRAGFDAPVHSRSDDHLNRWPLARQIYRVAVDGPEDWSARIGLYGEWGTGKTSVLKFVSAMAEADKHIVVWFDPWAYSSKPDLWAAFVIAVGEAAEKKLGAITWVGEMRKKLLFDKGRKLFASLTKVAPTDYGTPVAGGLELLRHAFAFGSKELEKLKEELQGRRVIILIDDLDRTAAELVPEILYALKEVMDVPGFSFICGFDPHVVGKVLAARHLGFSDGLKFLDKIIDYPVWLPPPTADGLRKIAESDVTKYCPFVPGDALRDVLELLPANPRSIRQFVRLCALLKTQAARHGSDELHWPIILTSNVIKTRFPMLDHDKLHSSLFYGEVGSLAAGYVRESREKVSEAIKRHVATCLNLPETRNDKDAHDWLGKAMMQLAQHINELPGARASQAIYQATLAERPSPLTRQEFDSIFSLWEDSTSAGGIGEWIARHADAQGFHLTAVARELVSHLCPGLRAILHLADTAFNIPERERFRPEAQRALSFLEELTLRPAAFHSGIADHDWLPLELIVTILAPLIDSPGSVHAELWPQIERVLLELVERWDKDGDSHYWRAIDVVRSIGRDGEGRPDGKRFAVISRKLNDLVDDRLSEVFVRRIEEYGCISRMADGHMGTRETRLLIKKPGSRLWKKHRSKIVAAFSNPQPSAAAQANAYAFIRWILQMGVSSDRVDDEAARALMSDGELMLAIWETATWDAFLGPHVDRIRAFPEFLATRGCTLPIPYWWDSVLQDYQRTADRDEE